MSKDFKIREFYIAITNRCNLACIMCTTGKGRHNAKNELTTRAWQKVITNLNKDCLVQRVTFGGGEPLLRKDLAKIIKFTCSSGVEEVNIISNGILLNEKFLRRFNSSQLKKLGINISIDGLEYDHNYIRGPGAFEQTFKNFELLYYNFFKLGKIKNLVISSTLMQENFARYINFLEFFKRYEGIRIDIQPVIPNNEVCYQKKEFKLTELERNKLQEIIDYLVKNINLSTRTPEVIKSYLRYFDNNLAKSGRCATGYESLNITSEGYPYLCGKQILAPMDKHNFKEVFHSSEYQLELERMKACRQPCLQGLHLNPEQSSLDEDLSGVAQTKTPEPIKKIIPFKRRQSVFNISFDKLNTSIFKKLQGPEVIEWFPTYLCNSKCQYCGGYGKEAIAEFDGIVPFKDVIKWIESSSKSGTAIWNIGGRGGEALLYPDLIGVLETIKAYKMDGILITNGLLLDEQFSNRLVKAKWNILRISLDSHLSEIHDGIRGVAGNFKIIDNALALFEKLKKENGSDYPYIVCCPVITNKNYKYLAEYIEYCVQRGVNEIQFMPLNDVHERAKKLSLTDEQKNELMVLLEKNNNEERLKHNLGFIISLYKNSNKIQIQEIKAEESISFGKLYCIHLWKTLVISEDGYLSPCSIIKDKLSKINESLLDGWNSPKLNDLRKMILRGELLSPDCKNCCGPLRNETENFNQYLLTHKT